MTAARIGSLFSGIGGIELALESFGMETAWQVENDPHASAVLARHWPDVPNLGDITAIDWNDVESVDVICGGFPCQDISLAGKGAGIKDGTRSGLWSYFADALGVLRPRYAFIENVSALAVRGLDRVLRDLAEIGFDAEWICLRASDIGAPHQRERLFLVATNTDHQRDDRTSPQSPRWAQPSDRACLAAEAEGEQVRTARLPWQSAIHLAADSGGLRRIGWEELDGETTPGLDRSSRRHADGCAVEDAGRPLMGVYEDAIQGLEQRLARRAPLPTDDRGRLNSDFVEWMMGFPPGWTTGGRSHRLRMLGNAVVPQQAQAAWKELS